MIADVVAFMAWSVFGLALKIGIILCVIYLFRKVIARWLRESA